MQKQVLEIVGQKRSIFKLWNVHWKSSDGELIPWNVNCLKRIKHMRSKFLRCLVEILDTRRMKGRANNSHLTENDAGITENGNVV